MIETFDQDASSMSADVRANNEKKEVNNKTQQPIFSFKICKIEIKRKHIFFLSKSVFSIKKVMFGGTQHHAAGLESLLNLILMRLKKVW